MYDNEQRPPINIFPDGRIDTTSASRYLGLSTKTLAMLRCKGTGPRFIKRGRVFYFLTDLDEWINKGAALSTAQCANKMGGKGLK